MKKLALLLVLALVSVGISGCGTQITNQKAEEIALNDAHCNEKDVSKLSVELNDKKYYVTFENANNFYKYVINGKDGAIISKKITDNNDNNQNANNNQAPNTNNTPGANNQSPNQAPATPNNANPQITQQQAIEIALKHANITSPLHTFAKLEMNDGILVYDVEFNSNNLKYDYNIDAHNGNVISFDTDSIFD